MVARIIQTRLTYQIPEYLRRSGYLNLFPPQTNRLRNYRLASSKATDFFERAAQLSNFASGKGDSMARHIFKILVFASGCLGLQYTLKKTDNSVFWFGKSLNASCLSEENDSEERKILLESINQNINEKLNKLEELIRDQEAFACKLKNLLNENFDSSSDLKEINLAGVSTLIDNKWMEVLAQSKLYNKRKSEVMNEIESLKTKIISLEKDDSITNQESNDFIARIETNKLVDNQASHLLDEISKYVENTRVQLDADFKDSLQSFSNNIDELDEPLLIHLLSLKLKNSESKNWESIKNALAKAETIDQELQKLSDKYEKEMLNFKNNYEKNINNIIADKEKNLKIKYEEDMDNFLRRFAVIESANLLESAKIKEHEMEEIFEIKKKLLSSQVRTQVIDEFVPIFSKVSAIEKYIKESDECIKTAANTFLTQKIALEILKQLTVTFIERERTPSMKPLADKLEKIKGFSVKHIFMSPENDLVDNVLHSVTPDVWENGLYTRNYLQKELEKVCDRCHRVAFLQNTQLSLWKYFCSSLNYTLRLKSLYDEVILLSIQRVTYF